MRSGRTSTPVEVGVDRRVKGVARAGGNERYRGIGGWQPFRSVPPNYSRVPYEALAT